MINTWWTAHDDERYWLESTDRDDVGIDLRAPEYDEAGRENWRYSLFKHCQVGDVVVHYNTRLGGIVGHSEIAGEPERTAISWVARGSYSRRKESLPTDRPAYRIPLRRYLPIDPMIPLAEIRLQQERIAEIIVAAKGFADGALYFPFEVSEKRPIRVMQGYAFKLPREFLRLFPQLRLYPSDKGTPTPNVRNPPWSRDELILALDVYRSDPLRQPGKNSKEVRDLSTILNRLNRTLGRSGNAGFRNAAGVYMKLMNFRRLDPRYKKEGKVGLARGGKLEEAIWIEFAQDDEYLQRTAETIRSSIASWRVDKLDEIEPLDAEATEGQLLTRIHIIRERSPRIVALKKQRTLKQLGRLECECCGFNYEQVYGSRGKGFIECHHAVPLRDSAATRKTRLEDLRLVCANCHRMIHATSPWLTVESLRSMIDRRSLGHEIHSGAIQKGK